MSDPKPKIWFCAMLASNFIRSCWADIAIVAPTGGVVATNTLYPFLIKQATPGSLPSMRYQQVYNSSLFTNLGSSVYLQRLEFYPQQPPVPVGQPDWTVPNMQINLSTTSRSADRLSPVFSENIGPDDQMAFGPGGHRFYSNSPDGYFGIFLDHSFRYNPALGNLLLDVRIFDGSGPFDTTQPSLEAFDSPTDEVSRVWSTNVNSSVADGVDMTGLITALRFGSDSFLTVPVPRGAEVWTEFPLLIRQTYPQFYPSNVPVSMRYQQVYNSSLSTNLDPTLVYITSLPFILESPNTNYSFGWAITNMQISLSTTTNNVGGLNRTLNNNSGTDEVVALQPAGTTKFLATTPDGLLPVYLTTPFRYNPSRGNLLLDVRLSDMSGSGYSDPRFPYLEAFNTPTNLVSRAWSTNVTASAADGMDTIGLTTIFGFSPIPTLRIYTSYFGTPTNWFSIEWPTQPTVFVLQRSTQAGPGAVWETLPNVGGGPTAFFQRYYFPVNSAGPAAFYRLVWPNGQ